ncbi:transposase [Algimonas arctica]|uniref:Transposase n=2 Tax=Algimonas arctica TaxID=1479486 RepID=A0A8J3G1D0_9PROT|nr:transposase [Algimonas arctica]
MCRVLGVHASGFYAWLRAELKPTTVRRARLSKLAKQSWLESGGIYGYRKVHHDLMDAGEPCAPNTVARIMRSAGLRAQVGYRRRPGKYGTKPAVVAANRLQQDFNVDAPDRVWVTDITYIRTHEGWLYLAAVIDLFSRKVVGWSMQPRMHTKLALDALMMAVWRRRSAPGVIVHSDQGSQFSSQEWRSFLDAHNLVPSMSRRGNCYDIAVAESFFHLLKTERIRRKTYLTRVDARQDVFEYIEMFYNPKRRHANNGMLSPVQFELAAM